MYATFSLTARHGAVLTQLLPGPALSVSQVARQLGPSRCPRRSELVSDLSRAPAWCSGGRIRRNRRRTLVSLAPAYREPFEAFIVRRSSPLLRALASLSPSDQGGFCCRTDRLGQGGQRRVES